VYMTFGSVVAAFPAAAAVYRQALEVLGELPVRALLTVGRELELGDVPSNVHVEQWVPQADVLAHAALVICHGGSGTTLGALAAGRPLVVLPLFADQPFNAARAGIVGVGMVASVDTLRRAVESVLADGSFAAAAARVAREMRKLPPVDEFLHDVR
jgi:MGT family glycosyltransferase